MRREFYEVYRNLFDIYRLSQFDVEYQPVPRRYPPIYDMRNLRTVEDSINEAVRELPRGKDLRPDARLFLFVNTHQMVALPLAYSEGDRLQDLPVETAIRSDVATIVQAAAQESPDADISGHAVVDALSRVWNKLRTTELNVWG